MKELQANEASMKDKMLRLSVETGGCSGFQYVFLLDDETNSDDRFAFLFIHSFVVIMHWNNFHSLYHVFFYNVAYYHLQNF